MGNQPSGWVAGPYMRTFPCLNYWLLDQDNPAVVTPNVLQLYNGGAHGEWQTLLGFDGHGLWTEYYGLVTGQGGVWDDEPLDLRARAGNSLLPSTFELVIEVPTVITAYTFDWNTTQAWTWQAVGTSRVTMPGNGPQGNESRASWHPATGPGIIPRNTAAWVSLYMRLRVTRFPGAGGWGSHELETTWSGARNPVAENWCIVVR